MRRLLLAVGVAGTLLGSAAPALADSKMNIAGGVLYFRTEDAGISNALTVDTDARGRAHFFDEADPYGMSYPTPPCSPGKLNNAGNAVEVFCTKGSFTSITIEIGPGEDRVAYRLDDLPVLLVGAAGADGLASAGAADNLSGGQGNDSLDSGAGNDTLGGDEGDDTIRAGDGNDQVQGGLGTDTIDAGPGDDTVTVADGIADTIDCGDGNDTVKADNADQLANCEQVTRSEVAAPGGQPSANDKTRPAVQAGGSTSQKVSLRRRRFTVAVTASEASGIDVSGYLDAGGIFDRLKPATSRVTVGGGGVLVPVTLSRTQAKRVLADLRRHRKPKVRVTVTAVDAAGNTSRPRHLTITLRR